MSNFAPLTAFLDSIPETYQVPAVDMIIVKDGETIYRHSAGMADPATGRPVSDTDMYSIFSSTKIATCVGAMRLIQEGKLSLEDPVSKYIPSFAHLTVKEEDGTVRPAKTVMTIEHLMSMRGGLDYNMERGNLKKVLDEKGDAAGTVEIAATYAEGPLVFDPGTHFLYSLCHDVLAAVIEVASGMRYSEYLNEVIFKPLGMKHTTFHPTQEDEALASRLFDYVPGGKPPKDIGPFRSRKPSEAYESGGGGLITTVDDYIELIYALANGGKARNGYEVLKPETVARYRTPELGPVQQKDFISRFGYMKNYTYCLGVRRMITDADSVAGVGNFGWDGAAGYYVLSDPERNLAYIYAQNVMGSAPTFGIIHGFIRELTYLCLRG